MNFNRIVSVLGLLVFSVFMGNAAPRQLKSMKSIARQSISAMKKKAMVAEPEVLHEETSVTVIGYGEGGFAVVANDDAMPEVMGVSDSRFSLSGNDSFLWWLNATNKVCQAVENGILTAQAVTTPDPERFPSRVDPLVTAKWDQDAPYWNLCPKSGYRTCLTGCVATAMAQIIYTNRFPERGIGKRTIYYKNSPVTADFEEHVYDYDNMLDIYSHNNYDDVQANAVAVLMRDCGVAADMEYSPDGSGTYTDKAVEGLRKYFGMTMATQHNRWEYTEKGWMELLYKELSAGHPVYYSGVDQGAWSGHAFVCDGYDERGRVHINWGWSGEDNGFFNISALSTGGYTFSSEQDIITGMHDPNYGVTINPLLDLALTLNEAGTLEELVNQEMIKGDTLGIDFGLRGLTLEGPLSKADFEFMRQLATNGGLRTVNLMKTDVTSLPDSAFAEAVGLTDITLPRGIESIGKYAFSGCTALRYITSVTYKAPASGTGCFSGVSPSLVELYLIAGSKDNYKRNAQWKQLFQNNNANVVEFGTTLKVNTKSREYGNSNPVFGYTIVGERLVGTPAITCEADKNSPVGHYTVSISKGTIADVDYLALVDGLLNVTKAPLTITAVDTLREFGLANPEFGLVYSGFKNGETSDVLLCMPVVSCEATEDSPVGTYPIVVAGADAENYSITYVAGTLTVTEPTAIREACADKGDSDGIYDLQGRRLKGAPLRGIYVKDGRKVLVY